MQSTKKKRFRPDDVITALLVCLPSEFNNDPEKIHKIIYELQKKGKYEDLLGEFEFVEHSRFPYSPLLGRILNRLQESRLLSSRNPDYIKYQIKPESKVAIESYFLGEGKPFHDQRSRLEEIAKELIEEL